MIHNVFQVDDVDHLLRVWGTLAEGAQQGSRAVVLLLTPIHLHLFLHAGATLRHQGLLKQGDFVFLMNASPVPYLRDPYVLYLVCNCYYLYMHCNYIFITLIPY